MRPRGTVKGLRTLLLALVCAGAATSESFGEVFHRTCCPRPVGPFFGYFPTAWRVGLPAPTAHITCGPGPEPANVFTEPPPAAAPTAPGRPAEQPPTSAPPKR